ncbi:MAG TPA: hypothetical protein VMZ06_18090 [Candidatus Bathyarchaeia archaeon]|nr:hypothetical protein [Candidatus Bathyarchaeia archaeon]
MLVQLKVFTLPWQAALGGFDDEPVRAFLVDKEVLAVDSQFFVKDGMPHWTVLVQYNLSEEGTRRSKEGSPERGGDSSDWRKALAKEDWGLFNRLREWRAERAPGPGRAGECFAWRLGTHRLFLFADHADRGRSSGS